ncbi:hypothetical protein M422DRAFT_69500 [Sphaerobolus stellatus SS14]|uniref:Uncharacterized protein n=1 Tax=Sphaerobolus stellatus (strain SS14) TaxID=990650 RepID=A0A0C9VHR6_SPHS4|nr:hypothetical protein M422DRAFT_69500 [Sphaerobolus stellatus SS14]
MTILDILSPSRRTKSSDTVLAPSIPDADSQYLFEEVVQLRRQAAQLEDDKQKLATENVKLLARLRITEGGNRARSKSILSIPADTSLSHIPSPPPSSPDVSIAASSSSLRSFLNSVEDVTDDSSKEPCETKCSEDVFAGDSHRGQSRQELLLALTAKTRAKDNLEVALCSQETMSQQLLVELLLMRKEVRTLHVKMETKNTLLTMVNDLHRSRRGELEVSNEKSTNQLLIQLLTLRRLKSQHLVDTTASKHQAPTSFPVSDPSTTRDINELEILRLSEAELRAEKESLLLSLLELIGMYKESPKRGEEPPINELVLGLVMAWKASQQRREARQKSKPKRNSVVNQRTNTPPKRFPLPSRFTAPQRKVQTPPLEPQVENVRPDAFAAFRRHYTYTNNDKKSTLPNSHIQALYKSESSSPRTYFSLPSSHKPQYLDGAIRGRKVFNLHNDTVSPSIMQGSGLAYLRWRPQ